MVFRHWDTVIQRCLRIGDSDLEDFFLIASNSCAIIIVYGKNVGVKSLLLHWEALSFTYAYFLKEILMWYM